MYRNIISEPYCVVKMGLTVSDIPMGTLLDERGASAELLKTVPCIDYMPTDFSSSVQLVQRGNLDSLTATS